MKVSFSGADDEFLNSNTISIPTENTMSLKEVITHIFKTVPKAHKSFFKADGTLANGTICLVDEEDAEIREDTPLNSNSNIVFISTLHGG